jgi:hypothetical protein
MQLKTTQLPNLCASLDYNGFDFRIIIQNVSNLNSRKSYNDTKKKPDGLFSIGLFGAY